MKDERNSYGGFSLDNIRKAVIKECLESGDPVSYFMCLQEVVQELDDEWDQDPNWLDRAEAEANGEELEGIDEEE